MCGCQGYRCFSILLLLSNFTNADFFLKGEHELYELVRHEFVNKNIHHHQFNPKNPGIRPFMNTFTRRSGRILGHEDISWMWLVHPERSYLPEVTVRPWKVTFSIGKDRLLKHPFSEAMLNFRCELSIGMGQTPEVYEGNTDTWIGVKGVISGVTSGVTGFKAFWG